MNILKQIALRFATMPHTRAFIVGAVDDAEERSHFRGMLVEVFGAGTIASAIAFVLFANVLMGPVQDAPVVGPLADAALPDTGISLPVAPRSPDGVTLCPKGWQSTPGAIPPEAIQQLSQAHVGARAFYVCRKDAFEVTIFDNGYISGYEGNNPLTPEDARRALTR